MSLPWQCVSMNLWRCGDSEGALKEGVNLLAVGQISTNLHPESSTAPLMLLFF